MICFPSKAADSSPAFLGCRVIEASEVAKASRCFLVSMKKGESSMAGLIGANGRIKVWCLSVQSLSGGLLHHRCRIRTTCVRSTSLYGVLKDES